MAAAVPPPITTEVAVIKIEPTFKTITTSRPHRMVVQLNQPQKTTTYVTLQLFGSFSTAYRGEGGDISISHQPVTFEAGEMVKEAWVWQQPKVNRRAPVAWDVAIARLSTVPPTLSDLVELHGAPKEPLVMEKKQ